MGYVKIITNGTIENSTVDDKPEVTKMNLGFKL